MEADYPDRFRLGTGAPGGAHGRPIYACGSCEFETDTTLDDGGCPACGGPLRPGRPRATEASAPVALDEAEGTLAGDFGALLERFAQRIAVVQLAGMDDYEFAPTSARASESALSALARVKLSPYIRVAAYLSAHEDEDEPAKALARILSDASAEPALALEATNASFGPALSFMPHGLAAFLCAAAPLDGTSLANGSALAGRLALFKRGGCSFAAKAVASERAKAVGAVVVQSGEQWPFTMADSTGEAASVEIPSMMVDARAGAELLELLARAEAGGGRVLVHATAHHARSTCAVCLELFQVETEACELPCSHCFHEQCIAKWLAKSTACPVCRGPVVAPAGAADAAAQDGGAAASSRHDFAAGPSMYG
jgi:hypothetical protein